MRAFKLGFLTNAWADGTASERADISKDLSVTLGDFAAVQAGLRDGDSARDLSATTNVEAIGLLTAVDDVYAQLATNINTVTNGDDSNGSALKKTSTACRLTCSAPRLL
jgi:hypothetical protein